MNTLKLVLNGEFIEKQTEKSFDQIKPIIGALSQKGKISFLTFTNAAKRSMNNSAYCLDVNSLYSNNHSNNIIDSILFTLQGVNGAMPHKFNGIADPSTESMFFDYNKFTVKFPVITFNTIKKLLHKIFSEAEITEDVFETLFYSDEEVDTEKIVELCVESGWLNEDESEFLINQLDFVIQLVYDLIKNKSQSILSISHNGRMINYDNEKDFLSQFVVDAKPEEFESANNDNDAFYDKYDFTTPR